MSARARSRLYVPSAVHWRLGSWTACGLTGAEWRPASREIKRVTCRSCKRSTLFRTHMGEQVTHRVPQEARQ